MKIRFILGVLCIGVAAMLFAYRGEVSSFILERATKPRLPRAVNVSEVQVHNPPHPALREERDQPSLTLREGGSSIPPSIFPPKADSLRAEGGVEITLPVEFNLAVPFTSQAPFAVWDAVHDDACEEASVMMVDAFYKDRRFTAESADAEILANVQWETDTLGHWEDTTAEETARILRERYGYARVRVVQNPTIMDMKKELVQGRPVILPVAGRLLGNRYFRQPGPDYHMLVVRGWLRDGRMITNDPGTKRGEGYLYTPAVLMNALHDWNGGDVLNGSKVMIVVEK